MIDLDDEQTRKVGVNQASKSPYHSEGESVSDEDDCSVILDSSFAGKRSNYTNTSVVVLNEQSGHELAIDAGGEESSSMASGRSSSLNFSYILNPSGAERQCNAMLKGKKQKFSTKQTRNRRKVAQQSQNSHSNQDASSEAQSTGYVIKLLSCQSHSEGVGGAASSSMDEMAELDISRLSCSQQSSTAVVPINDSFASSVEDCERTKEKPNKLPRQNYFYDMVGKWAPRVTAAESRLKMKSKERSSASQVEDGELTTDESS